MDNYAVIKKDKLFLWYFKGIMIVIKCLMKNYNNKFYVIIVRWKCMHINKDKTQDKIIVVGRKL